MGPRGPQLGVQTGTAQEGPTWIQNFKFSQAKATQRPPFFRPILLLMNGETQDVFFPLPLELGWEVIKPWNFLRIGGVKTQSKRQRHTLFFHHLILSKRDTGVQK